MTQYRCPTKKDWTSTAIVIGVFTLICVLIAVFGISMIGAPASVLLIFTALLILVRWHAANTAYRCDSCGNEFQISTLKDLLTPHMLTTKYVRCPVCNRRTWALALKKADPVRNPHDAAQPSEMRRPREI